MPSRANAYEEIYRALNICITERGESYYNDRLADVIKMLEEADLIQLSDGAKCVFLDGFHNRDGEPLPLMVQKSDGGYNYASTDVAALQQRITNEHADRIIYVTDSGQALHFAMLFGLAQKVGWADSVSLEHVPFGLVLGPNGKKFKTRSGDTERLIDLIDEAKKRARLIMAQRHDDWDDKDVSAAADTLGIAALKYADLSSNRCSDYQFSYDKMLAFDGNTAAFVMYAYVRCKSILRQLKIDMKAEYNLSELSFAVAAERALALKLAQFPEQLDKVARDLMPNRLTDYLYVLAECFNAFFRDCRVLGDSAEQARGALCLLTARVLALGFHCLGIGMLERM